MSFTEPIFLIFLPVIVLLYRFFPKKARWALLLAASLLFYAWHSVYLLVLLIFSVLVSYGCARSMTAHPEKRRQALGWALAAELGLLAVFKYLNFLLGSAVGLCPLHCALNDGTVADVDTVEVAHGNSSAALMFQRQRRQR